MSLSERFCLLQMSLSRGVRLRPQLYQGQSMYVVLYVCTYVHSCLIYVLHTHTCTSTCHHSTSHSSTYSPPIYFFLFPSSSLSLSSHPLPSPSLSISLFCSKSRSPLTQTQSTSDLESPSSLKREKNYLWVPKNVTKLVVSCRCDIQRLCSLVYLHMGYDA